MPASSYVKQCQTLVKEYQLAGGRWPARKIDIAEWALANRKWDIPRESKLRVCAEDLASAMGQEYITDETGRRVRLKHVARMRVDGLQGSFWGDIRTMEPEHMRLSVAYRRKGIVAECRQLSNDVAFYNRQHPEIEPIQLVLDFARDVRESDREADQAA
jgi:hypothetical protein